MPFDEEMKIAPSSQTEENDLNDTDREIEASEIDRISDIDTHPDMCSMNESQLYDETIDKLAMEEAEIPLSELISSKDRLKMQRYS